MLTHWPKLLTGDCTVVRIGKFTVYPIHRVGYSSLMSVAEEKYVNEQITRLDHIDVLIRDPEQRFISGVNEYCRQRTLDIEETYKKIINDKLIDSHFVPQYIWLMKLYRFYKGQITIRPFQFIANITDVHLHDGSNSRKVMLEPIDNFVRVDREIIKNTTVQRQHSLKDIIKDYKHVLS
jgi:hypothetical protein